jgi:hypothetical protein
MKPSINEPSDESEHELDAFQRGFVFWESPKAEYMPPIDDAGRREWLEGFCQAHADYPDGDGFEAVRRRRRPSTGCWVGIPRCRP